MLQPRDQFKIKIRYCAWWVYSINRSSAHKEKWDNRSHKSASSILFLWLCGSRRWCLFICLCFLFITEKHVVVGWVNLQVFPNLFDFRLLAIDQSFLRAMGEKEPSERSWFILAEEVMDILHLLIGRDAEAEGWELSGVFFHEDY